MKDYYDVKRISNSSLSWLKKSPLYYKRMMDKEIDESTKMYFEKGKWIHMYILEPEEFDKNYMFLDYTIPKSKQQKDFCNTLAHAKKGTKKDKLINAYKKSYSTKEEDDKILSKAKILDKQFSNYIKYLKLNHSYAKILPPTELYVLEQIHLAINNHKLSQSLLYNEEHKTFGNTDKLFIKNEFPIYWIDPKYKLECKSMIDRLIIDYENKKVTIVDLKTTSHLYTFRESALEYSYNRQIAFYWMAVYWYFKNELNIDITEWEKEAYIVAVSKTEPFEVRVFTISDVKLKEALNEIDSFLDEIKWHTEEDKWDYPRNYYNSKGINQI